MKDKASSNRLLVLLSVATILIISTAYAAEKVVLYEVHDMKRTPPKVITPPERFGQPPQDEATTVLFDGKDTSQWVSDKGGPCKWNVRDGYMEVTAKAGGIHTAKEFGNCQLHIEWRSPEDVKGSSQSRGNSGIFFMGRYELQILDCSDNKTYADGQAAAVYGQYPPIVNVCRKPGQWQSYDVCFLRPIFDDSGKCVRPARITVLHNGVCVQNNVEIKGATAHKRVAQYRRHPDKGSLRLQDHGSPVRFRNIWIRDLPEQPYLIKQ